MKILAVSGSNSETSMNSLLVKYASTLFAGDNQIDFVDMQDVEMPIYKHSLEVNNGIPAEATTLAAKIDNADVLLLALPEHNGTYTTAFKNVFDWVSRIKDRAVFNEVPMLLMATSPGARGGAGVIEAASKRFPFHGGNVVDTFLLPFYSDNLDKETGKILNEEKNLELKAKIDKISQLEAILQK
ncbi:NADPH-dependent FMN reductase [Chryseobacterium sp. T1]